MLEDRAARVGNIDATEERLASEAVAGNADALEELLAVSEVSLRKELANQIPATFRSAFDIDDVIQITFIEAFIHIGQFSPRGVGSFVAWLTKLARNNLRDAIKELRREKRFPRNRMATIGVELDSHEGLLATLSASTTTPSHGASRIEAKSFIDTALPKLPPDYEKIVRLMDLEGKTAPEVAKEVGRSVGAVYMVRVRAHVYLRELLGRCDNFFSSGT